MTSLRLPRRQTTVHRGFFPKQQILDLYDQNGRRPNRRRPKFKKIINEDDLEARSFQGHPDSCDLFRASSQKVNYLNVTAK